MNTSELRKYLETEAMDEGVKDLEKSLAEHKKHCEAKERKCPYEAKIEQEIQGRDEADRVSGAGSNGNGLRVVVGERSGQQIYNLLSDSLTASMNQDPIAVKLLGKLVDGVTEEEWKRYRSKPSYEWSWTKDPYVPTDDSGSLDRQQGGGERRFLKISGVVGKEEDGDREIGKAVDTILDEAGEFDEYDSRLFGEVCGSLSDTLAEEALEEFGDEEGNLDLNAWENGKDAWIQKNIESINDRVRDEMGQRKSYYKEQEDRFWKTGRM